LAKLNAPLFSFGASGSIAKALVYFPWKGLNVVRSWVSPANPKTAAQVTQRGRLAAAVALIHVVMAATTDPLGVTDQSAYSLLGSLQPTPRTWFNTIVKQWLDQKRAVKIPVLYHGVTLTVASTQVTFQSGHTTESSALTSGKVYYGTSKSNLISSVDFTAAELLAGKAITGLTNGTKYYFQFRALVPAGMIGSDSGIYYATPTA